MPSSLKDSTKQTEAFSFRPLLDDWDDGLCCSRRLSLYALAGVGNEYKESEPNVIVYNSWVGMVFICQDKHKEDGLGAILQH